MAWIFDTYSMNRGHAVLSVVTGKPLAGSKYFEVHFRGKKVVAVGSQFPIGRAKK